METIFTQKTAGKDETLEMDRKERSTDYFDAHRDFFEAYARGSVKVEPAPARLDTFAFDLKKDTIYVNDMFYRTERGFSDEKTAFAVCHEVEHFLEKKAMVKEKGGDEKFARYLERISSSRAYGLLDNCIADIRENRAVVEKTSKDFRDIEGKMYRDDLFPKADFSEDPLHIQFAQAILRERRLPDEKCVVAGEVREKIDALDGIANENKTKLLDAMTDPRVAMSLRLKLLDEYVVPMMEELKQKDLENEKRRRGEEKGKGDSEKGEGEGEEGKSLDPNEVFKDAYKKAEKGILGSVPREAEEKAFKEWKEEEKKQSVEAREEEYAKSLGVSKKALNEYRAINKTLQDVVNPETNQSVVEELHELFARIIAKRKKKWVIPKYPLEEGDTLDDPVGAYTEGVRGNFRPKVWEEHEIKEYRGNRCGEVEISFVCDGSGSMNDGIGVKRKEQQKAMVLAMEALKDFNDMVDEERSALVDPVDIQTEVYKFEGKESDRTPIKVLGKALIERDRITVCGELSQTSGSTTEDFTPLETIDSSISPEAGAKMREGELKKIVIVMTDGESSDKRRVGRTLESLREKGVVVVGVGITSGGSAVLETYAPRALVAENATDMPRVLGGLLEEHLRDV